jgi:ferric-dicitrate binding protein FerR (iron transport regulator)
VTDTDDARLDDMLRQLAKQPVPPLPSAEAEALRTAAVAGIEAERALVVRRRAGRARWLRGLGAVAAAAAVALVVWVGASREHAVRSADLSRASVVAVAGSTQVVGVAGARPVDAESVTVGPDDEVATGPDAKARATLPTGATVEVGPSTRLRFVQAGEPRALHDRIELASGNINVHVPKLPAGSDLRVHAQDVTVVVHGTRFAVEQVTGDASESRPRFKVTVTEGRVAVYASGEEHFLDAGDVWVAPDPRAQGDVGSVGPEQPEASSTLAIENGLLSEAMSLRRVHQGERALALLDELLARHPRSPLAETASVERLRALEDLGSRARLATEAAGYLARYPQGFARLEAGRMLTNATGRRP